MRRIKWVQQEDDAGCGIACCAMVTGKAYQDVKSEMVYVYHGGVYAKHLRDYLYEQGYFVCHFEKWSSITTTTREWPMHPAPLCIACVVANPESGLVHFVVVHNGVVYDPASVNIKSLDEYVKVEWIMGLTKPQKKKPRPSTVKS